MKRILLALFLVANVALLLLLFKNGTLSRDGVSIEDDQLVIRQSSQKAVITLDDPAWIAAIKEGGLKVIPGHPNSETLIRVMGHQGPIVYQKIESQGKVLVINPDGLIVGDVSGLNSTLPPSRAEIKARGNVYALAIKEKGFVRAVELKAPDSNPTTFDYPDLETAPVILDE